MTGPMMHGSRRGSARWARPPEPGRTEIDVLVPTSGRYAELAVTLAGLAAQDDPPFRVIVSDQSETGVVGSAAVRAMLRVLLAQGRPVELHRHLPRRGLAEQRQFLLDRAVSGRVLYLDDDVWLEPGALERLSTALDEQACGFVGYAVQGLSYLHDRRPAETEMFEPWGEGGVRPEEVRPGMPALERWPLHNAANMAHVAERLGLGDDARLPYRVAWVGACALFDRAALVNAGGFEFWRELPRRHAGEDRVAQWRVMARRGGAGIAPSGAVHLESPTTVRDRRVEASDLLYGAPSDGSASGSGARGRGDSDPSR